MRFISVLTLVLAPGVPVGAISSAAQAPVGVPKAEPTLALDHVWIATETGAAAERAELERAGFRIAPMINRHDGQGTASATVEFQNGYLELIWPDDAVPVRGGAAIAKERFTQRADWRKSGHSPFGLALARTPATPEGFPFETWRVTADWMEPGTFLEMLTPRGSPAVNLAIHPGRVDEAAILRRITAGGTDAEMFLHPNGARRLTSVSITAPDANGLPPSATFLNESGAARLVVGDAWLMELTLDANAREQTLDLRPALPVVIRL